MKKVIIVLGIFALLITSCTKNLKAKKFGGSVTIELEENQKLINATWKDTDLWILTRDMKPGEVPEIYKFTEKSTFGVLEGEITFVEIKK